MDDLKPVPDIHEAFAPQSLRLSKCAVWNEIFSNKWCDIQVENRGTVIIWHIFVKIPSKIKSPLKHKCVQWTLIQSYTISVKVYYEISP